MEDILTSSVFGSMELCGANNLLIAFLKQARTLPGRRPFADDRRISRVNYTFWPACTECDDAYFAEPDLELEIILDDNSEHLLFVEAKFLSGKSSFDLAEDGEEERAPEPFPETPRSKDQLAKEWAQLQRRAKEQGRRPALIYLTADTAPPVIEIEESRVAASRVLRPGDQEFECFWLSWRHLCSMLRPEKGRLESELLRMLVHLDLHFFDGFRWPNFPQAICWRFAVTPMARSAKNRPKLPIGLASGPQLSWRFNQ
ncbi:MAG TPA: hypothetical protein VGP72_05310 [Planctomycetota bacterium]